MKKIFYLLLALTFMSCNQNRNSKNDISKQEEPLIIKSFLDNFFSENEDCFNNDITEKDCAKKIQVEFLQNYLGDSIPVISELPMKFERLMEYNPNKYVVKFAFDKYSSKYRISDKYDITFQVFSIVDKNTAVQLQDGKLYNVFGVCHSYANKNSFRLPSGRYFEGYPKLMNIDRPYIDLGTLIVENLTYKLIE